MAETQRIFQFLDRCQVLAWKQGWVHIHQDNRTFASCYYSREETLTTHCWIVSVEADNQGLCGDVLLCCVATSGSSSCTTSLSARRALQLDTRSPSLAGRRCRGDAQERPINIRAVERNVDCTLRTKAHISHRQISYLAQSLLFRYPWISRPKALLTQTRHSDVRC